MHIVLVGCGKMGKAILSGWLTCLPQEHKFSIIDPITTYEDLALEKASFLEFDITVYSSYDDFAKQKIAQDPDVFLLAVKPQIVKKILSSYQSYKNSLFISIIAGCNISIFQGILGINVAIVRCMPNTAAAIQKSITAWYPNDYVSIEQKSVAEFLLSAIGKTVLLEKEKDLHAVVALSGSGPAYIFYLMEVMELAGVELGLSADLSKILVREMISGSSALAESSINEASDLRKEVTSPQGTTYEALLHLMKENNGLKSLMTDAIKACHNRSIMLSK